MVFELILVIAEVKLEFVYAFTEAVLLAIAEARETEEVKMPLLVFEFIELVAVVTSDCTAKFTPVFPSKAVVKALPPAPT